MAEFPLLEAAIEHRRGAFTLDMHFTLRSSWTVLFGASGAGKTTLLRILSGLAQPRTGVVKLNGRTLLDTAQKLSLAPARRGIGFVLQQAALFPHLTARENIAFGLRNWTRAAREARIEKLLVMFAAEALAERKPRQLSGGERQRIALAQALASKPKLLLLDEPFNALDAATRTAMLDALHTSGVPVLYVSHDLGDAWQINADALLLEAGRITARGEARVILAEQREQILAQLGLAVQAAAPSAPSGTRF